MLLPIAGNFRQPTGLRCWRGANDGAVKLENNEGALNAAFLVELNHVGTTRHYAANTAYG